MAVCRARGVVGCACNISCVTDKQEREVAGWVAQLVQREYNVVPGLPTERDGRDGAGLTVDFTYDEADPPFAVEVTRLRDDFERPAEAELRRLEVRLQRHVTSKGWPHWCVGIRTETKLKSDLEPAIHRVIQWMVAAGLDKLGPGTYVHDVPADLLYRMGDRFMRDCDTARLAGVILITRRSEGGLWVLPVVECSNSKSLEWPLTRAFARKAPSMGRAKTRGYVTMLAIDIEREDAGGYLSAGVKAPVFPSTIDHLWLFDRGSGKAFHAKRDDRRLRAFDLQA